MLKRSMTRTQTKTAANALDYIEIPTHEILL